MRINPFVYGIVVLGLFLGTIGAFKAAGIWSTSGKVTTSGEKVTANGTDVNSIKGWMALGDIASAFNVPLSEILRAFNLPTDTDPATALKDLESDTFDVTALRDWLTARQQETKIGVSPSGTPAPPPVPANTAVVGVESDPLEPTPTLHVIAARTITGKVTFQQVLDWGVSRETIEKAIGGPMPSAFLVIKDYVTGQGKEFPDIKAVLQSEVDKAP